MKNTAIAIFIFATFMQSKLFKNLKASKNDLQNVNSTAIIRWKKGCIIYIKYTNTFFLFYLDCCKTIILEKIRVRPDLPHTSYTIIVNHDTGS